MATRFYGNIKAGTASVSKPSMLLKTADGTPDAGKVAAGLTAYYYRQGASATAPVTLSDLSTLGTAFAAGGLKEIADGLYRVDWPDAAFAAGADWVLLVLKDSTTAISCEEVALEAYGPADLYAALPANFSATAISGGGLVSANTIQVNGQAASDGALVAPLAGVVTAATAATSFTLAFSSAVAAANLVSTTDPLQVIWSSGANRGLEGKITAATQAGSTGVLLTVTYSGGSPVTPSTSNGGDVAVVG